MQDILKCRFLVMAKEKHLFSVIETALFKGEIKKLSKRALHQAYAVPCGIHSTRLPDGWRRVCTINRQAQLNLSMTVTGNSFSSLR